ncbi:MAG: hypothetical protein Q6L68_15885, partial [Thermostichus sp. DG02_5_bins_236]
QGYRFPNQAADLAQLNTALGSLLQLSPGQLASAIPTLQKAIDALENHSRAYVQQHQKNQAELSQIQTQLQTLSQQRLPALERRLATAPKRPNIPFPPNGDLNQAKQLLLYVEQEGIPAIQRWNSLREQHFEQAEQEIGRARASLRGCQEIFDRIEQSLRQAEQQSYNRGGNTVVVVNSGGSTWRTPSSGSRSSGMHSSSSSSSRRSSGGSSSRSSSGGSSRRR